MNKKELIDWVAEIDLKVDAALKLATQNAASIPPTKKPLELSAPEFTMLAMVQTRLCALSGSGNFIQPRVDAAEIAVVSKILEWAQLNADSD